MIFGLLGQFSSGDLWKIREKMKIIISRGQIAANLQSHLMELLSEPSLIADSYWLQAIIPSGIVIKDNLGTTYFMLIEILN